MDQYSSEESAIKRRQAIAQMLMQQGSEPLDTNQVAGGYVVPVSPLAGVAKVAQQLAGAYIGKNADERGAELQDRRIQDLTSIDISSPEASNKLMAQGRVAEAIALQKDANKVHREGVPTGFTQNQDGSIAPMPIAGGSNYMDLQLQLANQKAQIPSYGEPEKLDMAREDQALQRDAARRAADTADRQQQQFERQQLLAEKDAKAKQDAIDLANWRLENPNYEKYQGEISNAEANLKKLNKSLDTYKLALDKNDQLTRHNPLANSELQADYQAATWPLRDESMINTGVLNPGDKLALEAALTDPTSYSAKGFRSNAELGKQIEALKAIAEANVAAVRSAKQPKSKPPLKGESMPPQNANWNKVSNPQAEIDALRKSGQVDEANQLEDMVKKDKKPMSPDDLVKHYLGK